ncbi:cupin domain-containing protein [Haloechinothrix alba]|nr:cupin domain-containing protein [Haloechinothrix alba]
MTTQVAQPVVSNVPFHIEAPGRVIKWAVPGTPAVEMSVLAEGSQTNGQISVAEHRYPAGYEIGLHTHMFEDEGWYVAEGTVTFPMPDDNLELTATAGEFVWHPVRRRHGLRVSEDGPARLIQFLTPGTSLVPSFFEQLKVNGSPDSPDLAQVVESSKQNYGVYLDTGSDDLPPRTPSLNHGPLTSDAKLIVPPRSDQHLCNRPYKSDKSDVRSLKIGRGMMTDVEATFHAFGAQTGNALGMVEINWGPGDVAGAHVHTLEDEGFYVLDGEITLRVAAPEGVVTAVAQAGDLVWAPRELAHYYEMTGSEGARVLVFEVPGGSLGEFFIDISKMRAADIESDEALAEAVRWMGDEFGIYFLAPGEFPEE